MRRTSLVLGAVLGTSLLGFVVVGCGDDGETTTSGSGGSSAGGGGGSSCPEGSHPGADACEASLTGWTAGPSLKHARDHHVTFVADTPAGAFLYAMAGTTAVGSPAATVERSAIGADGTLGAFESLDNLPSGRIGPGFAQVDRGFVVGGGLDATGSSTGETWVGHVEDDGTLTITDGPSMAVSRYHVALVESGGFVYALGGLHQEIVMGAPSQTVEPTIERATFDGTTLGAFTEIAPLPAPTTHHAAVAHDGAIYVIGGGGGLNATTDILRATVGADGSLGTWEPAGTLPEARATSSAFVYLDHLYVVAGMAKLTGGERDTVLRAPIDAAGQVGTFEELAPLPLSRAHSHQAPRHGALVFSVAGSIMHEDQKEVFVGRFQ
jgi:hypothetical protein